MRGRLVRELVTAGAWIGFLLLTYLAVAALGASPAASSSHVKNVLPCTLVCTIA
jgi:hypothetical protein